MLSRLEERYGNFLNPRCPVQIFLTAYFRTQTPYPEDSGKTIIRMEKTQMQKLGIEKGNVVQITGGKTTCAFCLPLEPNYDTQDEKKFVFLDESSKSIPMIKPSDLTYANLRNFHFGNLVKISKANAVKASKVTILPMHVLGNYERKDFSLDWLEEPVVVCKGDRIVGKHEDPKKIPGFFIIDAIPTSDAWIVDKNTSFVISDKVPKDIHGTNVAGGNLNRVIPLVKKIKEDDFEATLSSMEIYDDCMRLLVYVKDSIVRREDWTSGLCNPAIKAWDDLGNQYVQNQSSARGGTQFGGAVYGSADHNNFSEISILLAPTLDTKAQELTISIEQLLWDIRKHIPPPQIQKPENNKINMMIPTRLDEKFVIHGGPWQFKILLK